MAASAPYSRARTLSTRLLAGAGISAMMLTAAAGPAYAQTENIRNAPANIAIFERSVDDWRCPAFGDCAGPEVLNTSPIAFSTTERMTVDVLCEAGTFSKVHYASDRAPGWIRTRHLGRHPRSAPTTDQCGVLDMVL